MDNNSLAAVSRRNLDKQLGSFPGEVVRASCVPSSTLQEFEAQKRSVVSNNIIPITSY
jgi:hypothetical protein